MQLSHSFAISVFILLVEELKHQFSCSAPVSVEKNMLTPEEKYLVEYGYLSPAFDRNTENWEEVFKLALMAFQSYASIKISGEIDNETLKMMELPRCGNLDVDLETFSDMERNGATNWTISDPQKEDEKQNNLAAPRTRRKRYVLEGSRWKIRNLYYQISKYPSSLSKSQVDREIQLAFSLWEQPTHLTFHHADAKTSRVNIDIRFERREHGDGDSFDGRGLVTAHAFFPRSELRGQIHFDDEEEWTVDSPWGTNLFQVATHEIGHTLGLNHSDVHDSVMSPIYFNFNPGFKLHNDDIKGIQALYGKKSTVLCEDPSIDAISTMVDGFTYIFKGPYVYQMDLKMAKISEGYPKAISFEFTNLPEGKIDTVFTRTNNITYFFKGDKFWRFSNMKMDSGFPKAISDFFEGIPADLNAAMTFSADEKIYFFKGNQYYKFDHTKTPPVSRDYPKPLSDWKGIPEKGIDAAFRTSDQIHGPSTLFFRGNEFWRFNDKSFSVDVADPPYPRNPSLWLYGCNSS